MKSANTSFHSYFSDDGSATITLNRRSGSPSPLGKGRTEPIAFDDWAVEAPPLALSAVGVIQAAWAEDGKDTQGRLLVDVKDSEVSLAPTLVARLSDAQSTSIGLPRAAPLAIALDSRGTLDEAGFRIDLRWTRPNGSRVHATSRGARVKYEGDAYRLVEPLFGLVGAVERLNSAVDEAERYGRFAELKAILPEELDSVVHADGFIEGLRIAYAAGFSLHFDAADDSFTFDPVLFSRRAVTEAESGAVLDEAQDSLLPPRVQGRFAQRFRGTDVVRSAYLVGDGGIVYLDPDLKSALGIVRKAQRSDSATRKAFVRNPRRFVRKALQADEQGDAGGALDSLFIETEQFSARVTGIEVWRKPVLPWIVPSPSSWLPERFGLKVGEDPDAVLVELSPDQAKAALDQVETALASGLETVQIKAGDGTIELPVSPKVVETLRSLTGLVEAGDRPKTDSPSEAAGRFFLQVLDSFESVRFAPLSNPSQDAAKPPPPPPDTLRSRLKLHQVTGLSWLVEAWRAGLPGVLLADDMGLGKPLQALSFLAWVRASGADRRPALVVAPTGLLANWAEEIDRHLSPGALGALVRAYGPGLAVLRTASGRDIEHGSSTLDPNRWAHAGLVLTTYETMRDYQISFGRTPFSVIIYDEAQKLKNPASQVTAAARALNARFQIAMTGTPVENRLQDLWSILDVAHPGLLGASRDFEREYAGADVNKLQVLNDQLTQPREGRPPVLLRRMKQGHVEGLPDKIPRRYEIDMPPAQAAAYGEIVRKAVAARQGGASRGGMLEVLHHLRGASLHPRSPETGASDFDAYTADSARLKQLFVILDEIARNEEKVLIFCESLKMQAQLAVHLRRKYRLNHPVACISGEVAGDKRQAAVRSFQERPPGFDVMVLSPKAGGVGLTLTAANHVVHLSRWWNPAVEDQSTDRVHRIGQTRPVTVHLPLAIHPDSALRDSSFDLRLDALIDRKRRLSRDLLASPEDEGDLASLFDAVTTDERPELSLDGTAETSSATAPKMAGNAAASPENVPALATTVWPSRVVFRPGQPRDWRIFSGPLLGQSIVACKLSDPFAGARPESRRHAADFFKRITDCASIVGDVRVVCWDAESAAGPYGGETNGEQSADFQRAWTKALGASAPRLVLSPKSKRSGINLHDRSLEVKTRGGVHLVWDLGSGIEGLMRDDKECTVSVHQIG